MAVKTVEKNLWAPCSAAQMFALVDAVEDYPNFLPWCSKTEILSRHGETLAARVGVDYMGLHQSFATKNTRREPEEIRMTLLEGPFKTLSGVWHFEPLDDESCTVRFSLQYEFSNALLAALAAPVFGHIAATMADAFVKEAGRRYA